MCKVYNQVGCLTEIKLHLNNHNITDYKSVNELINFQKSHLAERERIISNHKALITQERSILNEEIKSLEQSIKLKKDEVQHQLASEIDSLKQQLNNLSIPNPNFFRAITNHIKKAGIKLNIKRRTLAFNFNVAQSVRHLTEPYTVKNSRYEYINSDFDNAVNESSAQALAEHDRRKKVIDEINSTIYGALGEQKVVRELEKLPDEYILINDFKSSFNPPLYDRKNDDHIFSIQIDHILLSPAGVFLIETKNWSKASLKDRSLHSPVQQIKRTNSALFKILHGDRFKNDSILGWHHWGERKIPIRNIIVFIEHKPIEEFQHVKILTLYELLNYVTYFPPSFSNKEIHAIGDFLNTF